MMFLPLLLTLLSAVPPQGGEQEWIERDLRGVEFAPAFPGKSDACARLWIEERTWVIVPTPGGPAGSYFNHVRTMPLGIGLTCQFSTNPATPLAFNLRAWRIVHAFPDASSWKVRAEPTETTGVPLDLPLEPFSTRLWESGERLIDSATTADAPERLEFRRPGPPPADLRQAAQVTLEGLNSGACVRIMSSTISPWEPPDLSSARLARVCELRRRAAALGGGFVSVTIGDVTTFDRIAATVHQNNPFVQGWHTRTTYLVSYTTNYAQQAVPADALFTKEGEQWRLVQLWF